MSFFRGALVTLLSNAGVTLLSLITSVIMARSLGPTGRGLMATVLLWPTMLTWAGALSLGYANIYFGASRPECRASLFGNSVWAALVQGTIVGVAAALVVPHFVHLNHLQYTLLIISLLTLSVSMIGDFASSLLYGTGDFTRLGATRLAAPLTSACLLLLLWATHTLTVLSAVLTAWAGGWLQTGITVYYLWRAGYVSFRWDLPLYKLSLGYSSKIHIGTLAGLANGRIDQLIMTVLFAPRSIGLYAFAVTLSELLKQLTSMISTVLFPKSAEADAESRRELSIRATRWTLIIAVVGAVGIAAILPLVVPLIWGRRFESSIPAARVLLPGAVAMALTATLGASLNGAGRSGVTTVAEIASCIVMVPLLFLWMPRYGIFGAGLASTIGYFANTIVLTYYFSQTFGSHSLRLLRPTRGDWHDLLRAVTRMRRRGAPAAAEA